MSYTVQNEGDIFVMIDEMGQFVEAFDTKSAALRACRLLNQPVVESPVRRVEGRYGCADVVEAAAVPAAAAEELPAPTVVVDIAAKKPAAKVTKADRVRECIAQVKAQGGAIAAVVAWAVENLGMTKALATAYAKNNWDKV